MSLVMQITFSHLLLKNFSSARRVVPLAAQSAWIFLRIGCAACDFGDPRLTRKASNVELGAGHLWHSKAI